MKSIYQLCGLLIVAIACSHCKKENTASEPASVVGFWRGKFGNLSTYPTMGYSLLFRSDGTMRVYDGIDTATANKAEGSYSLEAMQVNTHYRFLSGGATFSASATVDERFTFIEGTWGMGTNATNGGRFFVNKK